MQQRLREAREESLLRSVGRRKARSNKAAPINNGAGERNGRRHGLLWLMPWRGGERLRRGHAEVDFHDRGEDVWKALRF